MTDNVEQTETPQEQKQSSRNLTPLFEANGDCIGWICISDMAVNYPVMFTPKEPQNYLRKNFDGEYSVSGVPFLDDYIISRDRHVQSKDCCDFCNHRYGYDYIIQTKGAGQKHMREASEQ